MHEPKTLCELFQNSLVQHPRERAYLEKHAGQYRALGSRAGAYDDWHEGRDPAGRVYVDGVSTSVPTRRRRTPMWRLP